MPCIDCSVLHGMNSNKKKTNKKQTNKTYYVCEELRKKYIFSFFGHFHILSLRAIQMLE